MMKTETYLRFPIEGDLVEQLRQVARAEKIHFETPFMAYFDKALYKSIENIRANWSKMEIVEVFNKTICDRHMTVAALARSGQAVRTSEFGALPFLIVIESPPMHSSGIALYNIIKEQLQANPEVELYAGD